MESWKQGAIIAAGVIGTFLTAWFGLWGATQISFLDIRDDVGEIRETLEEHRRNHDCP